MQPEDIIYKICCSLLKKKLLTYNKALSGKNIYYKSKDIDIITFVNTSHDEPFVSTVLFYNLMKWGRKTIRKMIKNLNLKQNMVYI